METTIIKVLSQDSDLNYDVLITCMRSGVNRNKWDYQNVELYAQTFAGTPILCAFVGNKIGDGHNFKEVEKADGEVEYDFRGQTAERIVGIISDKPGDIWTEERDGYTWVMAKGKLWRFYNSQLVDQIAEMKEMEVSCETLVEASYQEGDVDVFTKWMGIGVTILGEGVAPAIPGAKIQEFAALSEEFKKACLKAAAYTGNGVQEEEKIVEPEATETTNKPHDSKNNAKESNMTKFSKKQVAELASKFEGYTVLAAGSDETGIHVCLMSADGVTATYTMDSLEDTVAPEKIIKVNAQVAFSGADWEMAVDAYEVIDGILAENVRANASLDKATADLQEANDKITRMVENEMNRRVAAAKATAEDTLAKFNFNRMNPVAESVLEPIMASIDNGEFSGIENEKGEWIGEEEVKTKVLASCAADVMQKDEAEANARKKQFIWEGLKDASHMDRGDVASLLNQLNI